MEFTLSKTSKHGTAYYTREGFKQAIAIPAAQFEGGVAPQTLEISGVDFATKQAKQRQGSLVTAVKAAPEDVKKRAREAARKAQLEVLAEAGISL